MTFLGDYPEDFATVTCMFTTHAADGSPINASSDFENSDFKIFKNGSPNEKTTTNGITVTSTFDGETGLHCMVIDTSNDTGDSGFWTAGSVYTIVIDNPGETVDGTSIIKVIGTFTIAIGTTVAKVSSNAIVQDSFAANTGLRAVRNSDVVSATAATITLDASASATNDIYNHQYIVINAGTGIGQTRFIRDYNGTTKVAEVEPDWVVNPDSTSDYTILPTGSSVGRITEAAIKRNSFDNDTGLKAFDSAIAQAGTSTTVTLDASASSIDDFFIGTYVSIVGGTGSDQTRIITDYDGTTKVATVYPAWITNPNSTSEWVILPQGSTISAITAAGLDGITLAILAEAYEGSETVQDFLRLARAALVGKASGLAGTTANFRDAADTKNRISATVDADGNRTAITVDPT